MELRKNSNVQHSYKPPIIAFQVPHSGVHKEAHMKCLGTYINKLYDEMPPLPVGEHGKHIFTGFPMALAYQEVPLLSQQLLSLYPGDGAMVPVMFCQGLLTHRDHVRELNKCLKTKLGKKISFCPNKIQCKQKHFLHVPCLHRLIKN